MCKILRSWSRYAHCRRISHYKYIHDLMLRHVRTWKNNILGVRNYRHEKIIAEQVADKMIAKRAFGKLVVHLRKSKLPRDAFRSLNRRAAIHHRNAVFRRWQRKVLGMRLSASFNSYAFNKIRSRSHLKILDGIFCRIKQYGSMIKIGERRIRRESWKKWTEYHAARVEEFEREYRADMMQHKVLLRRGLRTLRLSVKDARREKIGTLYFLKKIFRTFLANVRFSREIDKKAVAAMNHYLTYLVRTAFAAWRFRSRKADMFLMRKNTRLLKKTFR